MVDEKKYLDLQGLEYVVGRIDVKKANVNSPAFTGEPTAPTPEAEDSSTKIATTAFVKNQVSSANEWHELGQ